MQQRGEAAHVHTRATVPGPRLAKSRERGDSRLPCGVVCEVSEGNHLHDHLRRATRHTPFTDTQESVNHIDRYPLRPPSPSSTVLRTAIRTEADRGGQKSGRPTPAPSILHSTHHPNREDGSRAGRPLPAHRRALRGGARGRAPGMLTLSLTGGKGAGDFLP